MRRDGEVRVGKCLKIRNVNGEVRYFMYDEDKFHKEVFFKNYRKFFDMGFYKADKEAYTKKLGLVGTLVKNVNFSRNLIIVSNIDLCKEIFLSGFMNIPTLRSSVLMNVTELYEIYFGNRPADLVTARPESEAYSSEIDILEDVACFTLNYHEAVFEKSKGNRANILAHTIMRRYEYRESDPNKPPKLNWIFSMGHMNNLEGEYGPILQLFKDKRDNPMFGIVDLNTMMIPISKSDSSSVSSNVSSSVSGGECGGECGELLE